MYALPLEESVTRNCAVQSTVEIDLSMEASCFSVHPLSTAVNVGICLENSARGHGAFTSGSQINVPTFGLLSPPHPPHALSTETTRFSSFSNSRHIRFLSHGRGQPVEAT